MVKYLWRCGIGTSNPFAAFTMCEIPVKLWNSDWKWVGLLLLGLTFAGKKTHPDLFDKRKTTTTTLAINHLPTFSENVNALLLQQRRGIMICSSSCAREPSWENDVCHDVSCYISLWLAGENRKICATNHQMSPTCHYCSQLKIMPPVQLQFSARLIRVKRIKKNWSQSL